MHRHSRTTHLVPWLPLLPILILIGTGASRLLAADADPLLQQAYWIWQDKDSNFDPQREAEVSVRKQFDLASPVRSATLRMTAEGQFVLSVNGKEVGKDHNWQTLKSYDLKPVLQIGSNEIVIRAKTDAWYAGIFAICQIFQENNPDITILTDETWDCWNDVDNRHHPAENVIQGINGGWWNNCNRLMVMPPDWDRLNLDLDPPGIAWARPAAWGKIKVLAIHPRTAQFDTIELCHRADVDLTTVFSDVLDHEGDRAPFFPDTQGWRRSDVVANLDRAMQQKYDVIILGPIAQDLFYQVVAPRLEEQVRSGTGLVFTGIPVRKTVDQTSGDKKPADDRTFEQQLIASSVPPPLMLTQGVPFASLPGFRIAPADKDRDFHKVAAVFQYGAGRVVRLNLGGGWGLLANAGDPNDLDYEYTISFAIKALLWAAHREPAVSFKDLPADLAARQSEKTELAFALQGPGGTFDVAAAVRCPQRLVELPAAPAAQPGLQQGAAVLRPLYEQKQQVQIESGADTPVKFSLPPLPRGPYFTDITVTQGGKQVNWGTVHLQVEGDSRIAHLDLTPPTIDLSGGKPARVQATAALEGALPAGSTVRFTLLDNDDRVLQTRDAPVMAGAVSAGTSFLVESFATTLGTVRAELRTGGTPVDIVVSHFTTIRRDWSGFKLLGWGGYRPDHAGNVYMRTLASLGVDALRSQVPTVDSLDAADMVAWATYPGFGDLSPRAALNVDPALLQKIRAEVGKMVRAQLPFDPIAYTSGDELTYGGGDELPSRVTFFRQWLTARYGKIDTLNRQWGTDFASFDDIGPLTSQKPGGEQKLVDEKTYLDQASTTRNYGRWVDQWLCNYQVATDRFRLYRNLTRELDPKARVGTDCPMWPMATDCQDWYRFVQEFEAFAPYGRDGEIQPYEEARSFAKPDTFLGLTYGGYLYNAFIRREEQTDLEWQHWRVWSGLLRGFTSIWWYNLGPGGNESGISPGLRPFPCLQQASRDIARIRQGFDTLLDRNKARRDYGPIAVHDSIPSRLVTHLLPDFGPDQPFSVHCLHRILTDWMGQQYTYVSSEQIVDGGLRRYKVLILPSSLAVGSAEAAALRKFVEAGGILIADVRPGITDDHGKFDGQGPVPTLFGIRFDRALGRVMLTGQVSGQYRGVAFHNPTLKFPADPSLSLGTATAALIVGGTSLLTVNTVGKGAAICLNIPFNYYRGYPTPDSLYNYSGEPRHNQIIASILLAVLQAQGIQRPVEMDLPQQPWLPGLDVPYQVDGRVRYVSLTKRRMSADETLAPVGFSTGQPGYCYESLTGKYLGYGKSWRTTIGPGDVRIFAILPYQVTGLQITAKDGAMRGGTLEGSVRILSTAPVRERHVLYLEAVNPAAQVVHYQSRSLETTNGSARFSLPLALNEAPGDWTIRCTDVATGVTATARVTVGNSG